MLQNGACEVLPLLKGGGGSEKVLAMLKGGTSFWVVFMWYLEVLAILMWGGGDPKSFHSLNGGGGRERFYPALRGGGGEYKVKDP